MKRNNRDPRSYFSVETHDDDEWEFTGEFDPTFVRKSADELFSADGWELVEQPTIDDEWELVETFASEDDEGTTGKLSFSNEKENHREEPLSEEEWDLSIDTTPTQNLENTTGPVSLPFSEEIDLSAFERVTIPPFQEKRCCICNNNLNGKYGILFKADSGAEARIDVECAGKLNAIISGEDKKAIQDAAEYLSKRRGAVDPIINKELMEYIRMANNYLQHTNE